MSADLFWAGLVGSALVLCISAWYLRSVDSPGDWKAFHTLMLMLCCVAVAGVILLGAVGILHLTFGPVLR